MHHLLEHKANLSESQLAQVLDFQLNSFLNELNVDPAFEKNINSASKL